MISRLARTPTLEADIALGVRLAHMQGREISPADVIRVLNEARVKYVLVGAHAANGYTGNPRATVDVDLIVQFPKKAAEAVARAFPNLERHDLEVVIRFMDGTREAIDLMKPTGSSLWPELLAEAREVTINGAKVRIPSVEGVLAAKFAALVSQYRAYEDKLIDAGDFIKIAKAVATVHEARLSQLGDLVHPEGGKELLQHVADARAGRRLQL